MTQPGGVNRYQILSPPAGQLAVRGRRYGFGRHVNHDPRSRRFPFRADRAVSPLPVFHERRVPIFNQGELGSCTGNAFLGLLGTEPYYSALESAGLLAGLGGAVQSGAVRYTFDQTGATSLYGQLTRSDDFAGDYPPDDTGSDGLTGAKVLTADGFIPGYRHTFDVVSALAALQSFPLAVGTVWTDGMFEPNQFGQVRPSGTLAGGHEWILDEFVPAGSPSQALGHVWPVAMVGGTTSWGTGFGVDGRFYLTVADLGSLLAEDGDVIVLASPTAPAPLPVDPEPAPEPAPTVNIAALAADLRALLNRYGV